jgi:predicted membrane protein (TIGR00267 family)
VIVGVSTLVGSAVPLVPFVILPPELAAPMALGLAAVVLAIAGAVRAKASGSSARRAALEMVAIGSLSALAGYAIGVALRVPPA